MLKGKETTDGFVFVNSLNKRRLLVGYSGWCFFEKGGTSQAMKHFLEKALMKVCFKQNYNNWDRRVSTFSKQF